MPEPDRNRHPEGLGVRFELFSSDLGRCAEFYVGVLRFELRIDRRDEDPPYLYMRRGSVRIGAVAAWAQVDPTTRAAPQGIEIVLEVGDLYAERDAIVATGYPLSDDVTEQPWGLRDFRLYDPDGYYLRFTTPSSTGPGNHAQLHLNQ